MTAELLRRAFVASGAALPGGWAMPVEIHTVRAVTIGFDVCLVV